MLPACTQARSANDESYWSDLPCVLISDDATNEGSGIKGLVLASGLNLCQS